MLSINIFAGVALAQAPEAQQPPSGLVGFLASPIVMLGLIFAIIYFLIMRPQQKKQREHQRVLRSLKRGDKVVTMSGVYGTIASIDEKIIALQVDEKVRIKISRSSVAGLTSEDITS